MKLCFSKKITPPSFSHRPPPKVGAWFYEPLKAVENLEPPKGGYSSSLN